MAADAAAGAVVSTVGAATSASRGGEGDAGGAGGDATKQNMPERDAGALGRSVTQERRQKRFANARAERAKRFVGLRRPPQELSLKTRDAEAPPQPQPSQPPLPSQQQPSPNPQAQAQTQTPSSKDAGGATVDLKAELEALLGCGGLPLTMRLLNQARLPPHALRMHASFTRERVTRTLHVRCACTARASQVVAHRMYTGALLPSYQDGLQSTQLGARGGARARRARDDAVRAHLRRGVPVLIIE